MTKLAKVIAMARGEGKSLTVCAVAPRGVEHNSTTDFVVPALVASAARHWHRAGGDSAGFDQVSQEALTPDSKVNSSRPDIVLLALDYRALPLKLSQGDGEASAATVQGALGYLPALRDDIKANSNGLCIFQTFAPPVELLFGGLDRALPGTLRSLIDSINRELCQFVLSSGDLLLDVAGLAETVAWRTGTTHSYGTWASSLSPTSSSLFMATTWLELLPPSAEKAARSWCWTSTTLYGEA
jgi:hypothetical protein